VYYGANFGRLKGNFKGCRKRVMGAAKAAPIVFFVVERSGLEPPTS